MPASGWEQPDDPEDTPNKCKDKEDDNRRPKKLKVTTSRFRLPDDDYGEDPSTARFAGTPLPNSPAGTGESRTNKMGNKIAALELELELQTERELRQAQQETIPSLGKQIAQLEVRNAKLVPRAEQRPVTTNCGNISTTQIMFIPMLTLSCWPPLMASPSSRIFERMLKRQEIRSKSMISLNPTIITIIRQCYQQLRNVPPRWISFLQQVISYPIAVHAMDYYHQQAVLMTAGEQAIYIRSSGPQLTLRLKSNKYANT